MHINYQKSMLNTLVKVVIPVLIPLFLFILIGILLIIHPEFSFDIDLIKNFWAETAGVSLELIIIVSIVGLFTYIQEAKQAKRGSEILSLVVDNDLDNIVETLGHYVRSVIAFIHDYEGVEVRHYKDIHRVHQEKIKKMSKRKFVHIDKNSKLKYWFDEAIAIQNQIDSEAAFISPQIDHKSREEFVDYLQFRTFITKSIRYYHNSVVSDVKCSKIIKINEIFHMYCTIIERAKKYNPEQSLDRRVAESDVFKELFESIEGEGFYESGERFRLDYRCFTDDRFNDFDVIKLRERIFPASHKALKMLSKTSETPICLRMQNGHFVGFLDGEAIPLDLLE